MALWLYMPYCTILLNDSLKGSVWRVHSHSTDRVQKGFCPSVYSRIECLSMTASDFHTTVPRACAQGKGMTRCPPSHAKGLGSWAYAHATIRRLCWDALGRANGLRCSKNRRTLAENKMHWFIDRLEYDTCSSLHRQCVSQTRSHLHCHLPLSQPFHCFQTKKSPLFCEENDETARPKQMLFLLFPTRFQ